MLDEVVGQNEGVRVLTRVVEGHLTNPLLIVGPEGVGRRFAVMQAAAQMFCDGNKTGACQCSHCYRMSKGLHPDFVYLSDVEGKDIKVEAIRQLVGSSRFLPTSAPVRFFVIDGIDRTTSAAANALLKTLEEPPNQVRFFLLATSLERIIPTVRSRCGLVWFHELPENYVVSRLSERGVSPDKALVYARMSEGSVGRALRYWGSKRIQLRDQVVSLFKVGLQGDLSSLLEGINEVSDLPLAVRMLEHLVHDLLMAPYDASRLVNVDIADDVARLRHATDDSVLVSLHRDLLSLKGQPSNIKYPFHVKTALVRAFVG